MIDISVSVQDRDNGFNDLKRVLKIDPLVEVGYFASTIFDDEGVDVAAKAWANEYGAKNIPERSFMRSTIDENNKKINSFMEKQYEKVVLGRMSPSKFQEIVALFVIGLIKRKIDRSKEWAVANAAGTVADKGSDKPLVDTAQMRNSLDWKESKK